jgi:hypothetical protein
LILTDGFSLNTSDVKNNKFIEEVIGEIPIYDIRNRIYVSLIVNYV